MPVRRKKKEMGELPVSSFSDIAFLLIIFFILVSSFVKTKGFITDLPSGSVDKAKDSKEQHTVVLTGAEIQLDGKPLTMEELRERLKGMKLAEKEAVEDRIIMLEGAAGISYQEYFEAMQAIAKSGGIIAIVKEDQSKG